MEMYNLYIKASNFTFKYMPWTCIIYAWNRRRGTLLGLTKLYIKSGPRETDSEFERELGFNTKTKQEDFFSRLAEIDDTESEQYACVFGNCTVIWHPKRGNKGGAGIAGCNCQNLKDPRDLERGPL